MDATLLRNEVQNDPTSKGYMTFWPDSPGMIVEMLNAPTEFMVKAIKTTTAQAWAATGPYAGIVDAANDVNHPCRASCLVVRETLSSGVDIHLERVDVQQMLLAWVATGVCSEAQRQDLLNRALQPASRMEVLGLPPASEADLRIAMEG